MAHSRLTVLSTLGVFAFSCALFRCSTDEFSGSDAGSDATGIDSALDAPPPDTGAPDTGVEDVRIDAPLDAGITDADAGPPAKCDRQKAFGAPAKLLLNAQDVFVDTFGSFRIDSTETHAWVGRNNVIRQYDVTGTNLTWVQTVNDINSSRGFAISDNGLELIYVTPPANVVRMQRANIGSTWGSGFTLLDVPIAAPDGAAYQEYYHPIHLGNGPTFYFGRFVYFTNMPSQWDIFRSSPADAGDGSSFVSVDQSELHANNFAYAFQPTVTPDDLTMYFARWGDGITAYPRLARASRANAQSPWSVPTNLAMPPLPLGSQDTLMPFAITPDDCALYFGYNQSIDGSISTQGPFTVFVARRPL